MDKNYSKIFYYFIFSTISLKVEGWFIARSASTFRFKSMLFDICIWEGGFIGLTFDGIRLQEIQISGDNGLKIIQRQ